MAEHEEGRGGQSTAYDFLRRIAPQEDLKLDSRKWTWEEDGYTVIRSSARTGPGCHDNCGILMYIKDGELAKIEGDPENPYNQGRLCPRCLAAKEMIYHPKRLMYPMKRDKAKRGEDAFKRISWDEAWDIIVREMKAVIDKYGAKSIYATQGTGRDINGYGPAAAQFLGTPNYGMGFNSGEGCYAPRMFSTSLKSGNMFVCDYSQFHIDRYDHPEWEPPEYILIWGNNCLVSNSDGLLGHWVVECMKRGSKLIVFDPKLTWLGGRADVWLQLRCGTDAAMAIALCNHIIHEGLEDKDFVEQWTYGFDEFVAHIKDFTPEKAAEICDVSVELIRETAEKIGKAKNVCLQWGVPIDQQSGGFLTGMAQFDLLALTGNFEKPGTMLAARACFGMGITWMPDPDAWRELPNNVKDEDEDEIMNFDYPALVGMHALSQDMALDAMETEKPYPIKAMWMATNNALSCMSAAPQRLLPALQATEFNVCVELFMTPTVMAAADVVLPACSFAERSGLTGHQPYALSAIVQGISPLGECKSDQQIIWELGEKFNNTTFPFSNEEEFYDFCLKKTDFSFNDMRERTWAYPGFEYRKHEKGLLRPDGQAGFATSTGRYNFYCPEMNYFGLPPLAVYEEPFDSPVTSRDMVKTYPLVLSTGARLWGFFHSEHRQSPSMRRIHPKPLARINPKTAASYGIKQDDYILIENQYGSCKMYAELYEGLREDTVSTDHAWWFPERDQGDGSMLGLFESNVNQLLPMRPGSSGLGNSYKSQLCRISKCEE